MQPAIETSNFCLIVASTRARNGKTLLSRLLADYFILAGQPPVIFDTDVGEHALCSYFSNKTVVVDLDRVQNQMRLFDSLEAPLRRTWVIDLSHRSFGKFFDLMQDTDFVAEARSRRIEPVIFYVTENDAESIEQARRLRDRFYDCQFVAVENALFGAVRLTRINCGALVRPDFQMILRAFDPSLARALEDPRVSFTDFIRRPHALSDEVHAALRTWLMSAFKEIHQIVETIRAVSAVRTDELPLDDCTAKKRHPADAWRQLQG